MMGRVDFEPVAGAFMPGAQRTDFLNILKGIKRLKNIWELKQ
jgi:hypothetical protein